MGPETKLQSVSAPRHVQTTDDTVLILVFVKLERLTSPFSLSCVPGAVPSTALPPPAALRPSYQILRLAELNCQQMRRPWAMNAIYEIF